MSNWWLFPPQTAELQLDEKWAFVYKKQKHCDLTDPADHHAGDCWDHVAFDPEHRLVLGVISGKRSGSFVLELIKRARQQLQGRVPRLITTDEFSSYATAIELVFGDPVRPLPSGQGKKRPPKKVKKRQGLNYATVSKKREKGRVVAARGEPILVHATTSRLREAQLHRHIQGRDDGINCRMPPKETAAQFRCSSANLAASSNESSDAALPFLSGAAGLMLLSGLLRLQHGQLASTDANMWSLGSRHVRQMARESVCRCHDGCQPLVPAAARQVVCGNCRWFALDPAAQAKPQ